MKRDWDFIRQILTDLEEDRDVFSDLPEQPNLDDFVTYEEFEPFYKKYIDEISKVYEHVDLLVKNGYVVGITVVRISGGGYGYSESSPRLTMDGHDLLATMRSKKLWEMIKSIAKTKSIDLSFEAIKALSVNALQKMLA